MRTLKEAAKFIVDNYHYNGLGDASRSDDNCVRLAVEYLNREKTFPLQPSKDSPGPLYIPWSVAEKAYGVYAGKYGRSQSLEELARRGGFGVDEMDMLYPNWRKEVDKITELEKALAIANDWKDRWYKVARTQHKLIKNL